MHRTILASLVVAALSFLLSPVDTVRAGAGPLPGGVRLVMVETASCVYCLRWHKEVGPYYAASEVGRRAPLVRRDLGDPSLDGLRKIVYTPTFVLVRDGEEIDRLVGYPGAQYFWSELDEMLAKLTPPSGRGERFTYHGSQASTCHGIPC